VKLSYRKMEGGRTLPVSRFEDFSYAPMLLRACKHNAKQNVNMVDYDERPQFLRAYECNLLLRVRIM
jgi:hypothetical protein